MANKTNSKFKDSIGNWKLKIGNYSPGFTLIELLIVITIIGILATMAVAGWMAVSSRGNDSTRKSDLARIKQALQQEYSDTRTYPAFDKSKGNIFAATWQLTTKDLGCVSATHGSRLTPRYLTEIPHDPDDETNYVAATCDVLTTGQSGRYLYLTAPSDTDGPAANATSFALMATLELDSDDRVTDDMNPLVSTSTIFGTWYKGQNVTANYLIDSKNQ